MKRKDKSFLGLPTSKPVNLKTPAGSYIKSLDPSDFRRFYLYGNLIEHWWLVLILSVPIGLVAYKKISQSNVDMTVFHVLLIVLTVLLTISGIVILSNPSRVSGLVIRKLIQTRKIHESDYKEITSEHYQYIRINGGNKPKLIGDDYGIIRVGKGYLDIEMSCYLAHLKAEDIRSWFIFDMLPCGVVLEALFGEYELGITLSLPDCFWKRKDNTGEFYKQLREGIQQANSRHLAELKKGVVSWNQLRKFSDSMIPDLRGAILRGDDLEGVDLSEALLQGSDLDFAYLENADIGEANLVRASFREACLEQCILRQADLSYSNMIGADLSSAFLEEANLADADLQSANLRYAHLQGANLAGIRKWKEIADMKGTNIYQVKNPPDGFIDWAIQEKGAVSLSPEEIKKREKNKQAG